VHRVSALARGIDTPWFMLGTLTVLPGDRTVTRLRRLLLPLFLVAITLIPAAAALAQQVPLQSYQELRWRMIGPFRGGRTRAVAGVASQPNVFYFGAVNGGVWKSNDYGRTWWPIFDDQPTQSIGDIVVAPSDPNVVYVGSGEGLHRPDLSVGDGIYRSADAGKTWKHLGLRDGQQIPALAVDPRDPNRLYAAVLGHPFGPNEERGIFRSDDGGATWKKILYQDADTGGADVQLDPSNPDVIYATMWQGRLGPSEDKNDYSGSGGGVFKSTDGGQHWKQLKTGLPDNLVQAHLALAPSEPKRIYLVFSTTEPTEYATGKGMGFYRSDDAGESWSSATDDPRPKMKIGGGDLPMVKVDPKNPDVVYSTGIVTSRSSDGGKTWSSLRGAPGGDDYQNLWINPSDPQVILLVSDQGAVVTVNGGATWSSWYNQPTAQIYHVAVGNEFPYRVCGGQQESGSVCILSRGNDGAVTYRDWHPVGVIEYGYAAPDPLNPDILYGGGRNEVSKYHWSTGQVQNVTPIPIRGEKYRAERTEPLMFSPVDPHLLYYATNFLFQTRDGGATWAAISPDLTREKPVFPTSVGTMAALNPKGTKQRGAIYALAPSHKMLGTLWAGTDDGLLWITRDGGKNWKNITPPELASWSKVTQIDASHFDEMSAYASVSRLRVDDLRPYVYRTHDGGKTWQTITTGLPESAPVNAVREDPVRKGMLYAATETSVFASFDDGDHWQPLQQNLPHTSVRDLWVHDDDLIVGTHGRGFWIMDSVASLRQGRAGETGATTRLFTPSVAYRVMRSTYTDTPVPPDESMGENPPSGAIIDYSLGSTTQGEVTLEVLDSSGKLVRRYSSKDEPELSAEKLQKQMVPPYWAVPFRSLPTSAGMHRWVWDLRYAAPLSSQHEYPISAVAGATPRGPLGPVAVPGKYTVRLRVDGKKYDVPLTVKLDPRVHVTVAELQQQLSLSARLAATLSESSEAILQARSIRKQIKTLLPRAATRTKGALQGLDSKLAVLLEGPENPPTSGTPEAALQDANGDIYTLYGIVQRADAAPTSALSAAAAKTERDVAQAMTRWAEIKARDVTTVNAELGDEKLQMIRVEVDKDAEEGQRNEE
jgi:photosystem II stability/assembly factor-like uncharacterized protein